MQLVNPKLFEFVFLVRYLEALSRAQTIMSVLKKIIVNFLFLRQHLF